jgi:hypothetical protein
MFLSLIRDRCEFDGTLSSDDESATRSLGSVGTSFGGISLRTMKAVASPTRRGSRVLGGTSSVPTTAQPPAGGGMNFVRPSLHRAKALRGDTDFTEPSVPTTTPPPAGGMNIMRPSIHRENAIRGDTDFAEPSDSDTTNTTISQSFRSLSLMQQPRRQSDAGKQYLPGALGENLSSQMSQTAHGESAGAPSPYTHSRTPRPGEESLSQSLHQLAHIKSADLRSTFQHTPSEKRNLRLSLQHTRSPSSRGAGDLRLSLQTPNSKNSLRSTGQVQSMRHFRHRTPSSRSTHERPDDSSASGFDASTHRQMASVPFFEKLCWICEQLDYPFEYADIVGSQFLGLESASPVTHVDGHVPTMDELVEFLALAFICVSDFADLSIVVLDDFQWVDAFSWKIFRVLCKRGKKMLLISATRSHDKQALRRLSTALMSENQLQNQMTEISLGPLDFTEIRELIALVLEVERSSITESICTDIFQRTGGLPVFVVQVLENIRRKNTLTLEDGVLKWTAEGLKENVRWCFPGTKFDFEFVEHDLTLFVACHRNYCLALITLQ